MEPHWHVERWLPIPGCEGVYSVSDQGRVRSEARMVSTGHAWLRPVRTRILAQMTNPSGYLHVKLPSGVVFRPHRIHVLVLSAFIGPRPTGMHACHNDGDQRNNRLVNLRWDTPRGNVADCVRHGRRGHGELSSRSKFTNVEANHIRTSSVPGVELAIELGVSTAVISKIRRGESYVTHQNKDQK